MTPAPTFRWTASSFQFNAPTILIAPTAIYDLPYNGTDEGLATWTFPDGFGTYGNVTSGVFQIQVGYSLYDDDAYNTPTLSGGIPVTGTVLGNARLQFAGPEAPVPESA